MTLFQMQEVHPAVLHYRGKHSRLKDIHSDADLFDHHDILFRSIARIWFFKERG